MVAAERARPLEYLSILGSMPEAYDLTSRAARLPAECVVCMVRHTGEAYKSVCVLAR